MQVYLGTFLLAFAMLALEITLTRLLSVTTWYHLAFFAIATAMLGMTAGAATVYLRPRRFTPQRLHENLAAACMRFALAVPLALVILCLTPLTLMLTVMSVFAMLLVTVACSLPFYFAGIAITLVLTKCPLPIGKLYASDLIGASFGCLFVLGGLEILDAPSLILLCGSLGALAAVAFGFADATRRVSAWRLATLGLLAAVALGNATSTRLIRPVVVKGLVWPAHLDLFERWNSFSRVSVGPVEYGPPFYWGGGSPRAPKTPMLHYPMHIDGGAGTGVRQFHRLEDIDHLRFAVTNVAYHLRPRGGACIIGVGGGKDLQSALLFGHERVKGVDINPIFIDLLEGRFREFAGLADRREVSLVVDEARSYLSRSDEQFAVIQMSLIDTWAATGAGAFSLSENALYTVEAWQVFLKRLSDDGVLTVSRWYSPGNLGETGRLVSLAVAALLRSGSRDPARHLALVTCGNVSTLVLGKNPLREEDVRQLRQVCEQMEFSIAVLPGRPPGHPTLRQIVSVRSLAELERVAASKPLRYDPPTDEDPYFFNMLRLSHLGMMFADDPGVVRGNLKATLTLAGLVLSLLVVATATILVPLMVRRPEGDADGQSAKILWDAAVYFSLIGVGFMLVEIALIQKLSVLLSHPVYALGILLFTMILSTGIGSLLSERLPLGRPPWMFLYPLLAAGAILGVRGLLGVLLAEMITSGMPWKILVSIAVIFPVGVVLGFFFPTGMRLARSLRAAETPWYWALNGVFGVLASALAVFFSIFFGISTNFFIAAGCYSLVLVCVWSLHRRMPAAEPSSAHSPQPGPHWERAGCGYSLETAK